MKSSRTIDKARRSARSALLVALLPLPALGQVDKPPRSSALVAGGALLGAVTGAAAGAWIGGTITGSGCGDNPDYCLGAALPGAAWGVGIGSTFGAPLGAFAADRPRGKLLPSTLVSVALFGAEVLVLRNAVENGQIKHKTSARTIVVAIPVLQIMTSTILELRSRVVRHPTPGS